jgi:hypothetical protein
MASQVSIGLPSDQIMQRFLARRIFREIELKLVETDGTEHVGYITGFDERCLQLSTTPAHAADEPRSILVFWPIRRIEETGNRIDALDPDHRSKIRSYSHALRTQCENMLRRTENNGNGGNHQSRPRRSGEHPQFSAV